MYVIEEHGDLLHEVQQKTKNLSPKLFKTKNSRLIMQSKCAFGLLNVNLKNQDLWRNKKQKDYWVI